MRRYFKICLWSPLWFPVVLCLLAFCMERIWPHGYDWMPKWLTMVAFIVLMSLVFGGVQYLVTLILVWPRINFCDAGSWLKWILRLPLIYAPILLLGLLLAFGWEFDGVVDFFEVLPLAAFGLVLGYAYVAIWLLGYAMLRWVERRRVRLRALALR